VATNAAAVLRTLFTFDPVAPAGARIFETSAQDIIATAGQTITYTLGLAAGQVLSALVMPAPGLWADVQVTDPSGAPFAMASSAASGQSVLVESAPVLVSGVYEVTVSGVDGSTGDYTLTLLLNAGFEQERYLDEPNNTLADAEDLTESAIAVATNGARQMAGSATLQDVHPSHGRTRWIFIVCSSTRARRPALCWRTELLERFMSSSRTAPAKSSHTAQPGRRM
jgi:hypothetical protein